MGFTLESVFGLARVDASNIVVDGDETATFTAGTSAVMSAGIGHTDSTTISGSLYNTPAHPGDTLIGFNDAIVPVGISSIFLESYANWGPLWDSDATVQAYMDDWAFIDDHMTHLLSSTGTYGIVDMIAKLQIAKALVQINLDKYDAAGPILEPYAT
jgi:hypothetical protein